MELDCSRVSSSASRTPKRQPGTTKPRTSDDLADWYDARLRLHGSRGDSFVAHPVNENAAEGSVSLGRVGGAAKGRFAEVTIEHLDAAGLGTFRRE